jgi:hypothetical protein
MATWGTHAICAACYEEKNPGRIPARIRGDDTRPCCFCGQKTNAGIYYRATDDDTPYCACREDD